MLRDQEVDDFWQGLLTDLLCLSLVYLRRGIVARHDVIATAYHNARGLVTRVVNLQVLLVPLHHLCVLLVPVQKRIHLRH